MISGSLPLPDQRDFEEVDEDTRMMWGHEVFPDYALRIKSNPDSESRLVTSSGDPIWVSVREEAMLEAEKEPILSSFLSANILSHGCLEKAVAFVLANRLQNPTLLTTQLMDTFCEVMLHNEDIRRSIRSDVQAFKDRDPACSSYCSVVLYMKGYHSLQVYRVAHALWNNGRKLMALVLQSRMSEVFGVDIHPAAKIGEGVVLENGMGLVIGETAAVGNRVSLMQGVTLGGTGQEKGDRHPKIGEGALLAAGATIIGNIKIGEGAMVAAGSLVSEDIPPNSMAAGVPATIHDREQERGLAWLEIILVEFRNT